ncbi:MAG: hypothetical protein F4046_03765, partial [Acidimicrobiaceae bacterium]|nr:hypothetical protein [Acidimicrobiaceae bacterium]
MNDRTRSEPGDSPGANAWVIDEMRDLWAADPASVDAAWRALFEGETPDAPITPAPPPASTAARTTIETTATDVTEPEVDPAAMSVPLAGEPPPPPAPKEAKKEPAADAPIGEPIKGIGARIVSNM